MDYQTPMMYDPTLSCGEKGRYPDIYEQRDISCQRHNIPLFHRRSLDLDASYL